MVRKNRRFLRVVADMSCGIDPTEFKDFVPAILVGTLAAMGVVGFASELYAVSYGYPKLTRVHSPTHVKTRDAPSPFPPLFYPLATHMTSSHYLPSSSSSHLFRSFVCLYHLIYGPSNSILQMFPPIISTLSRSASSFST